MGEITVKVVINAKVAGVHYDPGVFLGMTASLPYYQPMILAHSLGAEDPPNSLH